jgi:drug/metabolite transporter (DMT)-like permease
VIAILGGLGAAILWATANLASSRAGRIIGASSTLAWMMLVGLVVATPFAVASGPLPPITPLLAVWLTASGFGSVIGLMFVYRGLRIGKVGVVLALASTEGAIVAVFSVISGESLTIPTALVLAVIAVGIAVVALGSGGSDEPPESADAAGNLGSRRRSWLGPERTAVLYGVAGAISFGFSMYGTAKAGISIPVAVAILPARAVGVLFVFIPLALAGRLRMTRSAVPIVIVVALGEVVGNASFVLGAQESISVASVLASQYAAVAAVAAFILFRERLTMPQRSGFVAIAVGVAIITVLRG